jgi:regulation of enolase protein 1 (concanavalin A-like superfamily)
MEMRMRALLRPVYSLFLAAVLVAQSAGAADSALGPFEAQKDIGAPKLPGSTSFDGNRFTIKAAGSNMMAAHDEFHFVWREMKGDFTISARIALTGPGAEAHRKAGLMARAGLGDAAAYVDATVHGNGPKALQVRRSDGGQTEMLIASAAGAPQANAAHLAPSPSEQALPAGPAPTRKTVQLERHGNRFTVTIREEGQPEVRRDITDVSLPDTLYVGMFVCAHNPDVVETAVFDQVRLVPGR